MKKVLILAAVSGVLLISAPALAGNCDHSWQHASDGSLCGGRADDQKPGGQFEPQPRWGGR
jgi:hypothetical protein